MLMLFVRLGACAVISIGLFYLEGGTYSAIIALFLIHSNMSAHLV